MKDESEIINRRRVMPKDLKVPEYFMCPLSGKLMREPAMIESGVTFEKSKITAHFHNQKQKVGADSIELS